MDNPITPSLSELVRHVRNLALPKEQILSWSGIQQELSTIAEGLSRLMAEGGLVEPLQPSASLEVKSAVAATFAAVMEEFADQRRLYEGVMSDKTQPQIVKDVTKQRFITHDHMANRIIALQASEGCGSSNPVDDGAVERVTVPIKPTQTMLDAGCKALSTQKARNAILVAGTHGDIPIAQIKMRFRWAAMIAALEAAERHMPMPRMTEKAQRIIEDGWKNDAEAHALLDLIGAEFSTDPMSTQCFDERIVERVRLCVAKRKAFEKQSGCF